MTNRFALDHLTDVPARALMLGDSHGNHRFVADAYRLADELACDVIVSVGDFGLWPGDDGQAFLDGVEALAADASVPVLVVPGNHDDYDRIDATPVDADGWQRVVGHVLVAPRGHAWRMGGHWWLAVGGAASIDGPNGVWPQARGPVREGESYLTFDGFGRPRRRVAPHDVDMGGWWAREDVTDDDVAAAVASVDRLEADGGRVGVLVTHEAPAEVDMAASAFPHGHRMRERLQRVVDRARPDVAVCGHWHRHVTQALRCGGQAVVLSADANPSEAQWCVVDCDPDRDRPALDLPTPWALRGVPLGASR